MVPGTYAQYTTRRVLTSEWIEGEKLSQSRANDVESLVRGPPRARRPAACRSPGAALQRAVARRGCAALAGREQTLVPADC